MKKLASFFIASVMAFSLSACGKEKTPEVTLPPVSVPDAETGLTKLEPGTTIKWMGFYDLNPTGTAERGVDVTLFEDQCGGKIEYVSTTYDKQYDDLAQQVLGGDPPDIFNYERISFPSHIVKGLYQPIDEIVDFTSPLWADMAETSETFTIDGKHYVAPIGFATSSFMYYNQDIIDDEGLEDPYSLYLENKWDWTAFENILKEYMSKDDPLNPVRKGVNGWFQPQIIQSTGKTVINFENGKFTNNVMDPDIARAHEYMSNLFKNGYIQDGWMGNGGGAYEDGTLLFYVMGEWAMDKNATKYIDATINMVPIPRDPNTETKYGSADVIAHMWIKGSTQKQGVKAWFECRRVAETEEQYADVFKEKFMRDHPVYTDEMYQTRMDTINTSVFTHTFDFGYGISTRMAVNNTGLPYEEGTSIMERLMNDTTRVFDDGSTPTWTAVRESFTNAIDTELDTINSELAKLQ